MKLTKAQMKVLHQARADGGEIVMRGVDATDPTPRRDVVERLAAMGLLCYDASPSMTLGLHDYLRLTDAGVAVLEGRSPELSRALDTLMKMPVEDAKPKDNGWSGTIETLFEEGNDSRTDHEPRRAHGRTHPAPVDAPFRYGRGPAPKDPYKRIIWAAARGQGTTLKPEDVQLMAGDTAIHDAATGDGLNPEDCE